MTPLLMAIWGMHSYKQRSFPLTLILGIEPGCDERFRTHSHGRTAIARRESRTAFSASGAEDKSG